MDDIVERLRDEVVPGYLERDQLPAVAADEIVRLRVENARLKELLQRAKPLLEDGGSCLFDNAGPHAGIRAFALATEIGDAAAAATTGDDEPATKLTGENLRDSGVRQSGGVSDGPQ